jgi:diguanylate cyclase (GGDEF)-like protein
VTVRPSRGDYATLEERMAYLLLLRAAMAMLVIVWVWFRPEAVGVAPTTLAAITASYVAVAVVVESLQRRAPGAGYGLITAMLLVDGLFLAFAMYTTGGTQSPIRFLLYLHLVAVSLLASYRTGLKLALWDSLLLFVVLYAQAARLLPAVDVTPGVAIQFDQMPVLNVTSFWVFALATSVFSALNERELRQRREDLQALVDVGARLDDVADPARQASIVLDGLVDRFAFERGLVLGSTEDRLVVLACRGDAIAIEPHAPDWIVRRAWERRDVLPVRRLDPARDPQLSAALPGARDLLVAPMLADGRAIGAIVVEYRARRLSGVERRIASMLQQVASVAALNLRNAVLLQHVQDLAERDSLTGAANRRMFQQTLERVLAADAERERVTAVLFVDLDDFKVVNDTLGHAAGDTLLIAVTERISRLVREGDLVARLGGDEFAILTEDDPDLRRSRVIADRLVRELRAPYLIGDREVVVTSSVGIASARDAREGAEDLVRNADVAMYMAKANGKSGFAIFDPGMHTAIRERHELSRELQRAVDLDQLRLVYQPIVDLETGRFAGVEALLRWEHPELGLVLPGRFIEIAEETGSILPIGRWVLREACREASAWLRADDSGGRGFVGVNVSAREIQEPGFAAGVRAVLAESGLDPHHLLLEITETALLKADPATVAILEELRAMGVRAVIDDFGTGYFSLSHLRQFPVDVLKVAREFVQDEDEDSKSATLADAIVALGRSLRIETVAEGIETAEQAERMRRLGCTFGQGYYFARPLDPAALASWLEAAGALPGEEASPSTSRSTAPGRARRRPRRVAASDPPGLAAPTPGVAAPAPGLVAPTPWLT